MNVLKQTFLSAIIITTAVAENVHAKALELQVYNNLDPAGFQVSSTLVMGKKEAILLDAQFTVPDAKKLVEQVRASGKTLKTVFITEGDPDYYFGLEIIKAAFPDVKILTTPAVLEHIQKTADKKMQVWGPQLGDAAPKTIVYPDLFTGSTLKLEGKAINIKHGVGSMNHRIYMYIPSIKAVVGGVMTYGNLHVWTADTQTLTNRQDWVKSLDEIIALKPKTVIPGHYQANAPQDVRSVQYTHDYLIKFDQELPKAANSAALIERMKTLYPNVGSPISIEIGAKVNKGEMKW